MHTAACGRIGPVAVALAVVVGSAHADVVRSGSGSNAAAIQAAVEAFRADLGTLNANVPGTFGTGRREINWDGVPDAASAPNAFPPNFFNVNSPRGVVLSTSGTGFSVSADSDNPTSTPVRFGNIEPTYSTHFATFSPQRLFAPLGSTVTDVNFFIAGTTTPATVRGFGSVFTGVGAAGTRIEFYAGDVLLNSSDVPMQAGDGSMSFLGMSFDDSVVSRVRIFSGTAALGPGVVDGPGIDVAVMDDFIFGEPVPAPGTAGLLGAAGLMALRRRRRACS